MDNTKNCELPLQGCKKVYQPVQKPNFLKYSVTGDGVRDKFVVGVSQIAELQGTDPDTLIPLSGKSLLNNLQVSVAPHIICGIKFSATDTSFFSNNPLIIGESGDKKLSSEISFQDFQTEFAYKNNILTVPVKILLDYRNSLLISGLVNAGGNLTVDVTFNVFKQPNTVYNI